MIGIAEQLALLFYGTLLLSVPFLFAFAIYLALGGGRQNKQSDVPIDPQNPTD